VNLISNDRAKLAEGGYKKPKKARSKFEGGVHEGTGKAVGGLGAATGVRGLRKSRASKKEVAKKEKVAREKEEGKEAEEEAELALSEGREEPLVQVPPVQMESQMKSKSSTGPKSPRNTTLLSTFCRYFPPLFLARLLLSALLSFFLLLLAAFKFALAFVMWEVFGRVTRTVSKEEYLMEKYMDQRGELLAIFGTLELSNEERVRWVELWSAIDIDGDNSMDSSEFLIFFQWSSPQISSLFYTNRLFSLFNRNFNGFVTIRDFLVLTWQYCPHDGARVAELAFRLTSRRGDCFDPGVSVLDLVDVEDFVAAR